MSSAEAMPVANSSIACRVRPCWSRLWTNPGMSTFTVIADFPIFSQAARVTLIASSSTLGCLITSTSGRMWAGRTKCEPTTRDGCVQASAMCRIGIPEVLEAMIVAGSVTWPSRPYSSSLASRFSKIASSTNSTPSTASSRVGAASIRS